MGRAYRWLLVSSTVANLGDGVFMVAVPLLAVRLTSSPALVAGVALAGTLPWLIFALPAGALADRLDRRRTMLRVQVVRFVVAAVLGIAVATDTSSLPLLYGAAFVLGVGETFFDTASQSILPMMVSRDELSAANGRLLGAHLATNELAGPPLGGALAGIALSLPFAAVAALHAIATGGLAGIRGSFRPERAGPTKLRADIAEGVAYVWRHPVLRTLGIMLGVQNLAGTAAMSVFPLFALSPGPMGLSEPRFGLLLAVGAVGGVLGSVAARRVERALGRGRALLVTLVVGGFGAGAPALTADFVPIAAAGFAAGAAGVLWNVVTVSLRQSITPDRLLGRMNATYRLLGWGTMPIGAALGGLLGEVFGLRVGFAVAALMVWSLVPFALVLLTNDKIRAVEAAGTPT